MKGTPVSEVDGAVGEFGRHIAESFEYDFDLPVRCDQCSEVIHQREPRYLLFCDRGVGHPPNERKFRLYRVECGQCRLGQLHFTATGHTAIVFAARFDGQRGLSDTHFIEKSGKSEGLDWNPADLAALLAPPMTVSSLSPTGFIRMLVSVGIDPRELVDPETGDILVTEDQATMVQRMFIAGHRNTEKETDDVKAFYQSAKQSGLSDEEMREYTNVMDTESTKQLLKLIGS